MKVFSKEWWFELATVDHEFYTQRKGWANDWRLTQEQKQYCAKRYAEAYHLEQMEEYDLDCAMIAERNERKRILGIIEKMKSPVVMDWVNEQQEAQARGWQMAMEKLIQKINSEKKNHCPECGYPITKKSFEDFERCEGCNWTSEKIKG